MPSTRYGDRWMHINYHLKNKTKYLSCFCGQCHGGGCFLCYNKGDFKEELEEIIDQIDCDHQL